MKKRQAELPDSVGRVRTEIEMWRRDRKKQSPMPGPLWESATSLAETYGVYRISQALRLSYDSLRRRVESSKESTVTPLLEPSSFVELGGVSVMRPGSSSVEIEMCKPDGSRMSVRVSEWSEVDVTSMIEEFWSRSR